MAAAAAVAMSAEAAAPASVPMPANYVQKHRLLFSLLGRPVGSRKEHHQLDLESSSGPVERPGGGGDETWSGRRSPPAVKDVEMESKKGAGLSVGRGKKRKEEADERKKAKREKWEQRMTEIDAR